MVTKYQNYDCGDTGKVLRPYGLNRIGHVFKPEIRHQITQVGMRLRKKGSPPAIYRVQLEACDNSLPYSNPDYPEILGQADFESAPITTLAGGEMKLVELDSPVIVEAEIYYGMVLWTSGGGGTNDCLMWYFKDTGNPYPRGHACHSNSVYPCVWVEAVDGDCGFEEWGNPVPVVLPTVITNPATDVEAETATGNGNITDKGGENCDYRGIVYGKSSQGDPGNTAPGSSGYDDYEDESGDFGTGAFTRSLTSLDQATKYYARAYAHNSAGYSYGDEVEFTTLIEPTVTTNPATGIGKTTATLNGTLDDDGNEACYCGFEWGETEAYGNITLTEMKTTGETFSQAISGLTPGKHYHFRAIATNSAGTSYGSNRQFFAKRKGGNPHIDQRIYQHVERMGR